MTTLVTEKVDILHHAQASLVGKLLELKRNIQVSDGLRSYFAKITDLMHRNLLSWYEDDYVIAKDMVECSGTKERSGKIRALYLHLFSHGHQLPGAQRVRESSLVSEHPR